jgi:hypothetical protein
MVDEKNSLMPESKSVIGTGDDIQACPQKYATTHNIQREISFG